MGFSLHNCYKCGCRILNKGDFNVKKGMFSKLIVTFVIIINILFTLGTLYIFLRTGSEPTALIGAWFTFTTVEVWQLAKIKRNKQNEQNEKIGEP